MVVQKEPLNPYLDSAGNPQLLQSVVAFVDILGYKDMTQCAIEQGQGHEFLCGLNETMSKALQPMELTSGIWSGVPAPWSIKTFSDNIVIGYPIHHKDGELELSIVLSRLGEFQLHMTLSRFFIRGAVAFGDLFMGDQIIFGPALIEAYYAEKHFARDPRIVLTKSAISAMTAQLKGYPAMQKAWHHDLILRDADGQFFLNYLDEIVAYEHDMGYPDAEALALHRDVVTEHLAKFAGVPPRWVKYLWTAMYHNFFCDERYDFPDSMKVDSSHIQIAPARLSPFNDEKIQV